MKEVHFLENLITSKLPMLYPDKKVITLHQKDTNLYNSVRKYAKLKELSIDKALTALGYEFINKRNVQVIDEEYILDKLLKMYPTYSYPGISDIKDKDLALHKQITKYVNSKDVSYKQLLSNLGFEKMTTYDRHTITKILHEYKAKSVIFSVLFGVSRQAMDNELKKEINRIPFWESTILTNSDITIFEDMINHYVMYHDDQGASYRIFSNVDHANPKFALFVKDNDDIKCVYSIPRKLQELLIQHNYHIYNENDLIKIQELLELLQLNGNKSRTATEEEIRLLMHLTSRNKNTPFTKKELIQYYGFENVEIVDRRFVSDTEIKELLESYHDPSLGFVKIPIDSDDYRRIVNLGRNRGYLLGEFIKSYGFSYQRRPDLSVRHKQKKELLQMYVVRSNEIYISSYDPLYYNLSNLARIRNINLDDYLMNEFGFKRIKLDELPKDYEQYNWRKYIVDFEQEEQFINYIELNMLSDDNKVYLDSQSIFYTKLFLYAIQYDHGINSILKEWGFVRTYDRPLDFHAEDYNRESKMKIRIQLLDKLRGIQGDLEREESTSGRLKRSKLLVQVLKNLYSDECQLCDYSNDPFIPTIIMNNGRSYSEVHHIHNISSEHTPNDESGIELDSYKNVIVVCAHHHKVLHFENGGYEILLYDKENKTIYFKNEYCIIPVITDYHLLERFD